jgi:peptidoglycan hydrolase-like protein with peptidoglycan-binding domain
MNRQTLLPALFATLMLVSPLAALAQVGSHTSSDSEVVCPMLTTALYRGQTDSVTGGQVTRLQNYLTQYFNISDPIVTGFFGPKTQSYLRQFQSAHGVSPVGSVGPLTRAAMARNCSGSSAGNTQSSSASTPAPAPTSTSAPSSTSGNGGVRSNCMYDSALPQTQTLSCPVGQTGLITQTRTAMCTSSTVVTWSEWTTTSNTCVTPTTSPVSTPVSLQVTSTSQPKKLIDSTVNGYGYGYGPSIIQADGVWHVYYCSAGTIGWDQVRHATSQDLVHWSAPDVVLTTTDAVNERASCDPSVVYYNAGDGPYYYMYYGGARGGTDHPDGIILVARATSPAGPFVKYTNHNSWELNATDPKAILATLHPISQSTYGVGQPSVVQRNGTLYQWFSSTDESENPGWYTYLSTSHDSKSWPTRTLTNIGQIEAGSVDVKYDSANDQFVMFSIKRQLAYSDASIEVRTSKDGITWSAPQTITSAAAGSNPGYIHNIGVNGDRTGALIPNSVVAIYGAPYNLASSFTWGAWDLYGQYLSLNGAPMPAIWKQESALPTMVALGKQSNDELGGWSAASAIDGNPASVYSSKAFATDQNDRGTFLAAWIQHAPASITQVILTARMSGAPEAFPRKYLLYVTDPGNTKWLPAGEYTVQPESNGVATVSLGQTYSTWGVQIIPETLGVDEYGNHYFQLAEIGVR